MPVTISLSETIAAPVERVWRALCDPAEVTAWDANVVEALDAPSDYPAPGQHVRWRCAGTDLILHDRPQQVEANRRLHALLSFGRQHLDETYRLTETPTGTRVDIDVLLTVRLPLIGPILTRLRDGPAVTRDFATSLQSLKRHCERP